VKIAAHGDPLHWYRPEIDGLRAVAIVPIILFHAGSESLSGGFVGVDVFFVISGYLITSIILNQLSHDRFSFLDFYVRRAKRILPALFLVLSVSVPLAVALMLPSALKDFGQSLISVATYSSNFYFRSSTDYFAPSADQIPLLHTWSLAVEEQFYLLYPALLYFLWRKQRERALLIVGLVATTSFALALLGSRNFPVSNFYLLPTRAWELLLGATASFLERRPFVATLDNALASGTLSLIGLALIVYSVFALGDQMPFPGAYALFPVVGAFLFVLFSNKRSISRSLLSAKPVVYIGKLSYSLYLWHFPVIVFAKFLQLQKEIYLEPAYLILITTGASILSFNLVENPIRHASLNGRGIMASVALASFVFATIGFTMSNDTDFYKKYNQRQLRFLASLSEPRYEQDWNKCSKTALNRPCVGGDRGAAASVVLFGDSHAFTLFHPLSERLSKTHEKLILYTDGNCPPILEEGNEQISDDCLARVRKIYETILSDKRVRAIVLVARWDWYIDGSPFDNERGGVGDKSSNFLGKLRSEADRASLVSDLFARTFGKLSKTGKKILIVDSIPEAGWNVPRKILALLDNDSEQSIDLSYPYRAYLNRNRRFASLLDSFRNSDNVTIVEPSTVLCRTNVNGDCALTLNGKPLYMDDNHVNRIGATLLSKLIVDSLAH